MVCATLLMAVDVWINSDHIQQNILASVRWLSFTCLYKPSVPSASSSNVSSPLCSPPSPTCGAVQVHNMAPSCLMPLAMTKMTLLGLLSVQIGFQPLLMRWYAREANNVQLRVGVIESMKLVLALLPLILTGEISQELKKWSLRNALQTTAVPALIYVLQNYLNQTAVILLDGVTFNVLNQTKIIWTALLVYLMLHRHQSKQQMAALALLCASAVLMTTAPAPAKPTEDALERDSAVFFTGAYQALLAAVLSALAGTIIQRALQTQKRNAYVVTMELSLMGQLSLVVWAATGQLMATAQTANDVAAATATTAAPSVMGMWHGWTAMTFVALLCQAVGGVIVGFVIKYCGNVEKSFAVVVGMIITALLESQTNGKPFGQEGMIAIAMVTVSTIVYATYPPKPATKRSSVESPEAAKIVAVDDEAAPYEREPFLTIVQEPCSLSKSASERRKQSAVEAIV